MGQGFDGGPNTYDFGQDFDYSVWVPGTQLDLVNVPWNNDYRDVVKFSSRTALNTYIDNLASTGLRIQNVSYVKPNTPVRINIPHSKVIKYNYLRVSNPLQPVTPSDEVKEYYYFILDANYLAPNTTELIVQLDVWQTYVYDASFGNCYVERGHIGIANENNFAGYGREYLTVPEGIDLGGDYVVKNVWDKWILSPTPFESGDRYPSYDVLVFSTVDLTADPGTVEAPELVSASGDMLQGTVHGANIYIFDAQSFTGFLNAVKETPWVTQGIISVTMIPKVTRYHPDYTYTATFPLPNESPANPPRNITHQSAPNWRTDDDFLNNIPARYRHLLKFLTYPYCVIEFTTYTGTPILIKPESWNDPHGRIKERASLVPPAQRVEFWPFKYNSGHPDTSDTEDLWPSPISVGYLADVTGDDYGEYVDFVTQIANFPTMAVVNNGALGYLAANTHGIAFQRRSADWTQQRAMGSAQAAYDVQTYAANNIWDRAKLANQTNSALTASSNTNINTQAAINAGAGIAGGAGAGAVFGRTGAMAGGVSGAVQGLAGALSAGSQIGHANESTALNNALNARTARINQAETKYARDTNKDLADWAARGDYANSIAGVNAKVQDAEMIQPSTSGQVGGETINIVNGGLKASLRWKFVDQATFRRVGEFWLRYGYAINSFITPPASLRVMTKFTYWKMSETYITSANIPESFKHVIRGILEKGVTVWTTPEDIGAIDIADNDPIGGISY